MLVAGVCEGMWREMGDASMATLKAGHMHDVDLKSDKPMHASREVGNMQHVNNV